MTPSCVEVRSQHWSHGLRYVFDKTRDHIKVKLPDPAGYNDDVGAHVNTDAAMNKIIERLNYA